MVVSKFQVYFHDFVQITSIYCNNFLQNYLHEKSLKILATEWCQILKLFQKHSNFTWKYQIYFYDFSQSTRKFCKILWKSYCLITWNKRAHFESKLISGFENILENFSVSRERTEVPKFQSSFFFFLFEVRVDILTSLHSIIVSCDEVGK